VGGAESVDALVALVPKPRVNLTRFHGVFAPNSNYRALITTARRGKHKERHPAAAANQTPAEKRTSSTPDQVRGRLWAKRLKRVFNTDFTSIFIEGRAVVLGIVDIEADVEYVLFHRRLRFSSGHHS